jgi:hypothetical protein
MSDNSFFSQMGSLTCSTGFSRTVAQKLKRTICTRSIDSFRRQSGWPLFSLQFTPLLRQGFRSPQTLVCDSNLDSARPMCWIRFRECSCETWDRAHLWCRGRSTCPPRPWRPHGEPSAKHSFSTINRIFASDGVFYRVAVEGTDLPTGVPIELELYQGNDGERVGLDFNPKFYEKLRR